MSHSFLSSKGRPDPVLIRSNGPVLTYKWHDTGEEFDIIVDLMPSLVIPNIKEVTLFAEWKNEEVSPKEIYALRRLFPDLLAQPISQISVTLSKSKRYCLGGFDEVSAKKLVESADKLGVKLSIDPTGRSIDT